MKEERKSEDRKRGYQGRRKGGKACVLMKVTGGGDGRDMREGEGAGLGGLTWMS